MEDDIYNEPKETEYDFYQESDEDGFDEEPPVTL